MNDNIYFLTIFKTNAFENLPVKATSHPVRVEIFSGSRSYKIPLQLARSFPANQERKVFEVTDLNLDEGFNYISITTVTKTRRVDSLERLCEDEIDRTISALSATYGTHIFDELIYRGWIIKNDIGVSHAWYRPFEHSLICATGNDLEKCLSQTKSRIEIDSDLFDRYTLMSRFFSKSLAFDPSEEKYLLLWTALEVFPMKSTSDIKAISVFLGNLLQQDSSAIKERLGIGRYMVSDVTWFIMATSPSLLNPNQTRFWGPPRESEKLYNRPTCLIAWKASSMKY